LGKLFGRRLGLVNISDVTNAQTAIYFVGEYVGSRNAENRLTTPILRSLFSEYIPSYLHILSALIRSSGRPPTNSWTKQRAIDYFYVLEPQLSTSGVEELLLYAVLNRYQQAGGAVTESGMAKLVSLVMARRNCSAPAAAQYIERSWIPDADGKGVKASYVLIQYQRFTKKQEKT